MKMYTTELKEAAAKGLIQPEGQDDMLGEIVLGACMTGGIGMPGNGGRAGMMGIGMSATVKIEFEHVKSGMNV